MTARQILAAGFSRREIGRMAEGGELIRLHRGVYALGHVSPAPESKWAAALLAAGPGAALSHTTVLSLHGLMTVRSVTEVTAPTQRRGDERLKVHHGSRAGEITVIRGLRATTLPRTFLDLAAARWPIARPVHEAAASGLVSLEELRRFALAEEGRPGVPALRAALAMPHTRSRRELHLHAELRAAGIDHEMNAPIGRLHVDALIGDLVLELDHDDTHGAAFAQERDARRDAFLRSKGYVVRRSTEIEDLVRAARAAGP